MRGMSLILNSCWRSFTFIEVRKQKRLLLSAKASGVISVVEEGIFVGVKALPGGFCEELIEVANGEGVGALRVSHGFALLGEGFYYG